MYLYCMYSLLMKLYTLEVLQLYRRYIKTHKTSQIDHMLDKNLNKFQA